MKPSTQEPKKEQTKASLFWMLFPVALLVTSSAGWLTMVSIALDDPGFAVESDYYKKASKYDEVIAQRSLNEQLGYQVSLTRFEVDASGKTFAELSLNDEAGAPLSHAQVQVEAFHNARAQDIFELRAQELKPGIYQIVLQRGRPGLWEFRLKVQKNGLFTQTLRPELLPGQKQGAPS